MGSEMCIRDRILVYSAVAQFEYGLAECIAIALENKKTLRSAELEVQSAEKGVKGSYSGLLPILNATLGSGRTQFPEQENVTYDLSGFPNVSSDTLSITHYNSMSAGLSLNQTLYDGGRSINTVQQAKINLEISKLNQRQIKIQVIQNVTNSYFGLLQTCLLYTSPSPRDLSTSRMPSSA